MKGSSFSRIRKRERGGKAEEERRKGEVVGTFFSSCLSFGRLSAISSRSQCLRVRGKGRGLLREKRRGGGGDEKGGFHSPS